MNDRRTFLKMLTAAAVASVPARAMAGQQAAPAVPSPSPKNPATLKKSTLISMLPRDRSYAERFAIGKEAGFEAIEIDSSPGNPHGIKRAAHSVVTQDLVDQEGHPTKKALDRVIAFFRERHC